MIHKKKGILTFVEEKDKLTVKSLILTYESL